MTQQVSWNRNLYLAIALCVLGGFAFWLEYKHKPEQEAADESSKKVFALKGEQIASIQLSQGTQTFKWECQDLQAKTCKPGDNSKWKLTEPLQVRADDSNVNSLVSNLSNLTPSETIQLKEETPEKRGALLKEYGLSPEALQGPNVKRVDIKASNGEVVAYIGGVNPINDNFFAVLEHVPAGQKASGKVDDSKVFQIPSYLKSSFDHDLTYWRDKKIMSFVASEIESFEIRNKKRPTISGVKKGSGWEITSGGSSFEGDPEMVDALLNGAVYLTAKNFVSDSKSDAKAKAALKGSPELLSVTFNKGTQGTQASSKDAPSSVTLTLFSNRKDSKSAKISKSDAHGHDHDEFNQSAVAQSIPVYAIVSNTDPLYELQPNSVRQFDKEPKDFRMNKLITSLDRFSVKKVEFSGKPMGDKPLALVAQDTKWIDAGSQSEVNGEKVQSFLDLLAGKHIQDFLEASKAPAGEQDGLKITLGDDQNPSKHVFTFWKNDGKLYARNLSSARKEAFLVDSTVMDGLPWDRNFFKK